MTSTQLRPAALAAPLLEALETAAWVVLVGPLPFGLEEALLAAAAASGRPVLLIDSRLEPEAELSQRLAQEAPPSLTFCSELLAAEAGEQGWYRYNDCRLNGTVGPDALLPQRPNLRLEGLELRPARRLDAVLLAWLEQAAADGRAEGLLWLPASLAPGVLAGAGVFLERLGAICLEGAAANGCADDVAEQLETSCYRLVSDGSDHQVWQLDRQSLLDRQLLLLIQQREVLTARVEELQGQLTAQSAQTAEQSQQREVLTARVEELQGQLTAQSAQTAEQSQQREVLTARVEELQGQLTAQSAQTAEQSQQREVLTARVEELQGQLTAQSAQTAEQSQQREVLTARVEELQGQLTAQSAQTAEQSQQREVLTARVEELQGQLTAQSAQTAEQSQQREVLTARVEELQGQLTAQSAQTAEQSQQREVLTARVEELQGQLTAQSAQTAEQSQQREVLTARVEELQGQLTAQSAQTLEQSQQREALGVRCEELQTLLSSQQAANAQMQSDREVLSKERDEWRCKAEAQEGRLQAINQELDEVLALLDAGTTDSPAADVEPIGQTG